MARLFLGWFIVLASYPCFAADGEAGCAEAALREYIGGNLKILQDSAPVPTVDQQIALRRLQERYCLQFSRCLVPAGAPNAALQTSVHFSACLKTETDVRERGN